MTAPAKKVPAPVSRATDAPLSALVVEAGAEPVEVATVVEVVVGKATEGAEEVTVALPEVALLGGAVHPSTL